MTRISAIAPRFLAGLALAGSLLLAPAATQAAGVYTSGTSGTDVSYPQCPGSSLPAVGSFAIVGVTGGKAFTQNSCLTDEANWAKGASTPLSVYMNLNAPVGSTAKANTSGPTPCATGDKLCQAHNYGWNAAAAAYSYAGSHGAASSTWWLDIETANSWAAQTNQNRSTIQGAADYLTQVKKASVGIYSTPYMWNKITGTWSSSGFPVWYAGTSTTTCSQPGFTGGTVWLVQNASAVSGGDKAC